MLKISTIEEANNVLRRQANEFNFPLSEENQQFINEFTSYFQALESAAGLAAPQVGKSLSAIIFHIPEIVVQRRQDVYELMPQTLFLNPRYIPIESEGKTVDWEACFSVPGYMGEVERYTAVSYQAYTLAGTEITGIAKGYFARILQHEIDHLQGRLYTDLITPNLRFGQQEEMMAIRLHELQQASAQVTDKAYNKNGERL